MNQPTSIQMLDAAIWQELGGEKAHDAEAVYHTLGTLLSRWLLARSESRNGGDQVFAKVRAYVAQPERFFVTVLLRGWDCRISWGSSLLLCPGRFLVWWRKRRQSKSKRSYRRERFPTPPSHFRSELRGRLRDMQQTEANKRCPSRSLA
jgi:hypothetical protein